MISEVVCPLLARSRVAAGSFSGAAVIEEVNVDGADVGVFVEGVALMLGAGAMLEMAIGIGDVAGGRPGMPQPAIRIAERQAGTRVEMRIG
jgi:hypothetical protein